MIMNNNNGLSAAEQIISKPIKGWEDRYSITNDGRVYSYISGRYLHKGFDKDGYALVTLSRDNYMRTYRIHRLVAETFVDNPDNKEEVNHKDFDRKNNWFENLEWVTSKENVYHSYLYGNRKLSKSVQKTTTLTDFQISQIDFLRQHYTLNQLAKLFNINYQTLKNITMKITKRKRLDNQQPSIYKDIYK